jgi:hypothetical protein
MSRKLWLIVLIIGLFLTNSYGQKLKMRITSGYQFPITSFSPWPFWPATIFTPNPSNDYIFTKSCMPPPKVNHPYFSIGLEWESKNESHFELRYHPYEGAEYIFFFSWNDVVSMDPVTGISNIQKELWGSGFLIPREKISLSASLPVLSFMIPVKRGRFQFHPMAGIAYMFVPTRNQNGGGEIGDFGPITFPDRMYNDSIYIGLRESTIKNHTIQAFAGIHFRYYSKKREWASLHFYYEQGLFVTSALDYWFIRNQKKYNGSLYSRGSAIHLKLSVPIDLYRFKKERVKSE